MIDKLNTSYKYVCDNSKYVRINYSKIDSLIEMISNSKVDYWLNNNPFCLMDMNVEDIVNFLLIYHTIGDYCFWGNPKWEINTDIGILDGSYAILYLVLNKYKDNKFNVNYEEFCNLLKGNVDIPLLDNRYNNLVIMRDVLGDKSFYSIIKNMTNDIALLEYIISNFPYFEDVSMYKGKEIYFYKRAQLLVSDILHVLRIKNGIDVDYSNLIGCADYKIPQVMRNYGMLEFDKELEQRIDNMEEIKENSLEEIEIRANDLEVINYIYNMLDKKYTRMDINDFIWLLGQDKSRMVKTYHRTLTSHY